MKKVWIIIAIVISILLILFYFLMTTGDSAMDDATTYDFTEAEGIDEGFSEGSGIMMARGSRNLTKEPADAKQLVENRFIRTDEVQVAEVYPSKSTESWYELENSLDYGQIPYANQVEINELVNAFTYEFPTADSLSFIAELLACPWNPTSKLLVLGVKVSADFGPVIEEPQWHIRLNGQEVRAYRLLGQENIYDEVDMMFEATYLEPGESIITLYELTTDADNIGTIEFSALLAYEKYSKKLSLSPFLSVNDKTLLVSLAEMGLVLRNSEYKGSASLEKVYERLDKLETPDERMTVIIDVLKRIIVIST